MDIINHAGVTLYRIQYKDGTQGGYLESEKNLSQLDDAQGFGNARVFRRRAEGIGSHDSYNFGTILSESDRFSLKRELYTLK